jgi:hypothetical protein
MSRRTIAVVMAAGLIAGLMAAPADAQRRRQQPRPVDLQYFVRAPECDQAAFHLSFQAGEDVGCGVLESGIGHEVLIATGTDPRELGHNFPAQDGLPLILDTSKEITGEITTRNFNQAGAGVATVEITVFGTSNGEEIEIGTHSETFPVAPTLAQTHELEIEIDSDLRGVRIQDLSLQVLIRGASVGHAVVEMNDPTSTLTVPVLRPRRR